MDERLQPLAELAVHGANVQPGQIVAVGATIGQHHLARAVAGAAYRRGALFVDVVYFDPYVKRERIANAEPESLGYVPPWYGARLEALGERDDARIGLAGIVHPDAFTGLDPVLVGRDQLPWLKETSRLVAEKSTNWSIIPCPHPVWARLVYPELAEDEAYERLWNDLWHVLRLDEPDPVAAWEDRVRALKRSAAALTERRFDAIELRGPGTDLTVGLFPTGSWGAARLHDPLGHPPPPEPADRRGLHDARPAARGRPRDLDEAARPAGRHGHPGPARALRGRPCGRDRGRRERGCASRRESLSTREQLDSASSHSSIATAGSGRSKPCSTTRSSTRTPRATSRSAFGFPFSVEDHDRDRINKSEIHVDFMIGSPELEVTGVTAAGERVPVLRDGDWQI